MARITIIRSRIQPANCVILPSLCGREETRRSVLMRPRVHYKPDFESCERLASEWSLAKPRTRPLRFTTSVLPRAISRNYILCLAISKTLTTPRRADVIFSSISLRRSLSSAASLPPRALLLFLRAITTARRSYNTEVSRNFAREARGKERGRRGYSRGKTLSAVVIVARIAHLRREREIPAV